VPGQSAATRGFGGLLAVAVLLLGIPSVALAAPSLSLSLSPATGGTYVPSQSTNLTLEFSNAAGADIATAAALSLNLPSGVTLGGVTCSATAGSSCGSTGGGTALPTGASVAAAGQLTVVATLNFALGATGSKTVGATGSATGATAATASTSFARTPATDLEVTAGAVATTLPINNCPVVAGSYTPGCAAEYQVVFTNHGPDDADNAQISLVRSEAVAAAFTWTCSASNGATCPAADGSGPFSATAVADFPEYGALTYTVIVQHAVGDTYSTVGVTGSIALPASPAGMVDLDTGNNSASSGNRPRRASANLAVATTALVIASPVEHCPGEAALYTPGCAANYTVVVSNGGPNAADGATLVLERTEAAAAALAWSCVASGGAACPAASGTAALDEVAIATFPSGGTLTYQVTVTHASAELYPSAGLTTSVAAPTGASAPVDINLGNNSATASRTIARRAALRVVKRATQNGQPISEISKNMAFDYEITLYNDGPSDIGNTGADPAQPQIGGPAALLADAFSSELKGMNTPLCAQGTGEIPCWSLCPSTLGWPGGEGEPVAGTGPGGCPIELVRGQGFSMSQAFALRAGTGSRLLTRVYVPSDSTLTSVDNTATVAAQTCGTPPGGCQSVQAMGPAADRTSTATVSLLEASQATILAENVGAGSAVPGTLHSYKITVKNLAFENLPAVAVTGQYPMTSVGQLAGFVPGTVYYQCRASGGACCNAGGACGTNADTPKQYGDQLAVTAVLPANASSQVVYTVTGMLDPRGSESDTLGLDASVAWGSSSSASSHVDTSLVPDRRLAIHKRLVGRQDAGGVATLSYEITATNNGPSHAPQVVLTDPAVPTTDFNFADADWACAAIPAPAPAIAPEATQCSDANGSGAITSGALMLDLMPGGRAVVELSVPVDSNAGAQVTNTARLTLGGATKDSSVTTTLQTTYALNVDKDDGRDFAHPGSAHSYTITVANDGPDDAYDVQVTDVMPSALQNVQWTCAAVSPVPGDLSEYLGQDSSDPLMVSPGGRPGRALALSADGRHVYVLGRNIGNLATIFAYSREATPGLGYGSLAMNPIDTEVEGVDDASDTGSVVAGMPSPIDLALRPDGAVLYVLSSSGAPGSAVGSIAVFHRVTSPVDPEHGRLSYAGSVAIGIDHPRRIVISPTRIYVSGSHGVSGEHRVEVYRPDSSNQLPIAIAGAGAAAPEDAGPMVINAAATQLFVASTTTSAVARYAITTSGQDAGKLTPDGTPLGAGVTGLAGANDMVLAGNGRDLYLHVGNGAGGRIAYLKSELSGLSVGLIPTLNATGTDLVGNPLRLALSPDGEHLLAVNQAKNAMFSVRRNPGSGGLAVNAGGVLQFQEVHRRSVVPGAIEARGLDQPAAIAVTHDNRHVIVASASELGSVVGPVVVFSRRAPPPQLGFIERDRQGDALIDALTAPADLVVRDEYVYALSQVDSSITLFKRRTALAGTEEDGRHLEVAHAPWRNQQGGITGMERPDRMLISADGKSLFVTSLDGDSLAVFRRNPADGLLEFATSFTRTSGTGHPGLLGAYGMAMDPDAGYLYVAGSYEAAIAIFQYQPSASNRLTYAGSVIGGQNGVTGMNGIRDLVVAGKDGQYQVMGVAATANTVVVFDQMGGGQLAFVQALSLGANQRPMGLALSPSINDSDNTHAYVVAQNTSSLHILQRVLDPSSPQVGRVRLVQTLKAGVDAPALMAGPRAVAVSANGKRVYVAAEFGSSLVAFDRYDNSGSALYGRLAVAEVRTQDVDAVDGIRSPYAVAVSGDSRNVYMAGFGSDAVASFSVGTGSSCSASGSGDIEDLVTIRAGGAVVYTVNSMIRPDATGMLENLAEASGTGGTDFDADSTTLLTSARLDLGKTNNQTAVIPGTEVTYDLTVRNAGPGNVTGLGAPAQANVEDLFGCTSVGGGFDCSASPFVPGSISWTCAASGSGALDFLAAYTDGVGGVQGLAGLGSLAIIPRGDSADPQAVRESFLVGASVDDDALVLFQRDAQSGALAYYSRINHSAPVVPLEGARAVAVGGGGRLLFAVSRRSDSLNVFSLSGSAAEPLIVKHRVAMKNPAIAGLDQALHLAVLAADSDGDGTPDTDHVYVAGANDHAVAAFAYHRASATLSHLGSLVDGQGGVQGLADVEYLVASPDGAHVYAISGSSASVTLLARNRSSGSPDFGKLAFGARFSGSALGVTMAGASSAAFDAAGKHLYLTAADANRVVVLNRISDPGAGNYGTLTLASSLGQGEQGARGLLNPRRAQIAGDGQHLYVTSQAGATLAWFAVHPQSGALTYLGIRSNNSGGVEGLGGATGLVLDPQLDQVYVAGTLDRAIAHFQRQSDSWCPSSGTGPLGPSTAYPDGVPVNIAAGGQVVFHLTARVASGLVGNLTNVATVNWQSASCSGGVTGGALIDCNLDVQDIDTPSNLADLSITKDDGLAEFDGLSGASALAADADNVYVAAPSDNAIGTFLRQAGASGGVGLRQVGAVRSGSAGISGLSGVRDIVASADGLHLYAASPVDNAVTSFARDPGNGRLTQIDLDQNGLLGVTGMSGARALALSPDGEHVYVASAFSNAVAIFRRQASAAAPDAGTLAFVGVVQAGVGGTSGIESPRALQLSGDGEFLYVLGDNGTLVAFKRHTNSGSANFGLLSQLQVPPYQNGTGGILGMDGVRSLALSDDDAVLWVLGSEAGTLVRFARDTASGLLAFAPHSGSSAVFQAPELVGATRLRLGADGHLYVAATALDGVVVLSLDTAGVPTLAAVVKNGDVPADPALPRVDGLGGAADVAYVNDGQGWLYAAGGDDSAVAAFAQAGATPDYLGALFDGMGGVAPGDPVTYTIEVANHGPSSVTRARVVDQFPPEFQQVSWTCIGYAGGNCVPSSGLGNIDMEVNLPAGGQVQFLATGTVRPKATGRLVNTATVEAIGVLDSNQANNSATDGDTVLSPAVDLSIRVDDDGCDVGDPGCSENAQATPGGPIAYRVVAANAGPTYAAGSILDDSLPAALYDVAWTCTPIPQAGLLAAVAHAAPDNDIAYSAVAVDALGLHVYAIGRVDDGSGPRDTVAVFERDPLTGVLAWIHAYVDGVAGTSPGGSPEPMVRGITGAVDIVVTPDGRFVYVAGHDADAIAVFARDAATGLLTWQSKVQDGELGVDGIGGISTLALSPDGRHLYAGGAADQALAGFALNAGSGALTQIALLRQGQGGVNGLNGISDLAFGSEGALLFATATVNRSVTAFRRVVASGALSYAVGIEDGQVGVSASLLAPSAVAVAGEQVFVADALGDAVNLLRFVDGASPAFELDEVVALDADATNGTQQPVALAYAADQARLYVASAASGQLHLYSLLDTQAERLASYPAALALNQPSAMVLAPEFRQLYLVSSGDGVVATLAREHGSRCPLAGAGSLAGTRVDVAPGGSVWFDLTARIFANASGPLTYAVGIDPRVLSHESNPVDNHASDTDQLVPAPDLETVKARVTAAADVVAGLPVSYLITSVNHGVSDALGAWVEDDLPLFPTSPAGLAPGSGAWSCAANLPLANAGGLTSASDPRVAGLSALAATPDGRRWFGVSQSGSALVDMALDGTGDIATLTRYLDGDSAGAGTIAGLAGASHLAVSPDGSHLYVTGAVSNSLLTFRITATGLEFLHKHTSGADGVSGLIGARFVTLSRDGRFVYIAAVPSSAANSAIALFRRDVDSGALTFVERIQDGLGTFQPDSNVIRGVKRLHVSDDGRHLYALATVSQALSRFEINPNTGVLRYLGVQRGTGSGAVPALAAARDMVATPADGQLYVLGGAGISAFSRALNGSLTAGATWPVPDPAAARTLAIDTWGSRLYLADAQGVVHLYARRWSDGALEARFALPAASVAEATALLHVPALGQLLLAQHGDEGGLARLDEQPISRCLAASGNDAALPAGVDLGVGGSSELAYAATVHPSARGQLLNVARAVPGSGSDPNAANNDGSDQATINVISDISISKTGPVDAIAGEIAEYIITVNNAGPSDALGVHIVDPLMPTRFAGATWTCSASAGSSCAAATGAGSSLDAEASVAVGGSVTVTLRARVHPRWVGPLLNAAYVQPEPGSVDPTPGDQVATPVTTEVLRRPNLSITKTNGVTSSMAGLPVSYTITVSNAGPSDAPNAVVSDVLPATLLDATWTCTPTLGTGICQPLGEGSISDSVDIPVGESLVYQISATLASSATGMLVNTASVQVQGDALDPDTSDNVATDTDTIQTSADLAVSAHAPDAYDPASPAAMEHAIEVANSGPSDAGQTVAAYSFSHPIQAAGAGCSQVTPTRVDCSFASIPAGTVATASLALTQLPALGTTLTASVQVASQTGDPVPSNNSANTSTLMKAGVDLAVSIDDGRIGLAPADTSVYVIRVRNVGSVDAVDARVESPLAVELIDATWQCAASGGASCGAASGAGGIDELVDVPAGAMVTFTLTATVDPGINVMIHETVVQSVQATADAAQVEVSTQNNAASDTNQIFKVIYKDGFEDSNRPYSGADAAPLRWLVPWFLRSTPDAEPPSSPVPASARRALRDRGDAA
jgi:uncharacterized repeat protein (TIGR01451 family)